MLLDDVPPEVYPIVGGEEREGHRGSVAGSRGRASGRMAMPRLPVQEDSCTGQLLVSVH